jgi:signal peptidase II
VLFYLTTVLVLVADQLSKIWIRGNLAIGESLFELGFFRIVRVPPNTGAAFGLLRGYTLFLAIMSIISALVILGCALFFRRRFPWLNTAWGRIVMGLILGGTLGNLVDRLRPDLGGITDFISVGFWPAFNLADSAIVIGALVFAAYSFGLIRAGKI